MRAARLGARAGEAEAAERLRADDRADHGAIDVAIAGKLSAGDLRDGQIDARMDAERQAVAQCVDGIEKRVETVGLVADDMENRPENLLSRSEPASSKMCGAT